MRIQTFKRIKNTASVLLVILFLALLTASTVAADTTTDVAAVVSTGTLTITDGSQGGTITISQPCPNKFTITGKDTTINGQPGPVTFSGVTSDLVIDFSAGPGSITFDESHPIIVSRNLRIMGNAKGSEIAVIPGSPGSLTVNGDLSVFNPAGLAVDLVTFANLIVGGDVVIQNQGGDCLVTIDTEATDPASPALKTLVNSVRGKISVTNGPVGTHQTVLDTFIVGQGVTISDGGGDTVVVDLNSPKAPNVIGKDLTINGPSAAYIEAHVFNTAVGKNMQITGSSQGDDIYLLSSDTVAGTTSIVGGDGSGLDLIIGGSTFAGPFNFQEGAGATSLYIGSNIPYHTTEYSAFERVIVLPDGTTETVIELVSEDIVVTLSAAPVVFSGTMAAKLGDGNDELHLGLTSKVAFPASATIDGQGGTNTALVHNANLPLKPTLVNFQVVNQ